MKKIFSILGMILAATFIFNACVSSEDTVSKNVNSNTVLDDQIFQNAVDSKNLESCDKILDKDKKEECKTAVGDLILTDNAVKELDKTICAKISNDRYEDNCEMRVKQLLEEEQKVEKTLEKEAEKNQEYIEIEAEAKEKKDADICNDIDDENQKYSCRYNIIVDQAITSNDPSLCDEIGEETSIGICKSNALSEK